VKRALTFGEALIDEYPDRRVVAGAPLHVAAHLASLGWSAALVTRLGDDTDGRSIISTLQDHDVDRSLVEIDPELPTGRTTIHLGEHDHDFTVHRPAAWDAIRGPDPIPKHDVVVFGSLPYRDERSREALRRVLGAGAFAAADANLRPPDVTDSAIRFVVECAHLLKVNHEELVEITALYGVAADPRSLLPVGPRWVCVTKGAAGAELVHRDGGTWSTDGRRGEVVDTVGAGDAFCAGLVHGLLSGTDPQSALDRARDLAAMTVKQRGGLPPN
jgi:sugar/nucleoside kinase (ribokinase family)